MKTTTVAAVVAILVVLTLGAAPAFAAERAQPAASGSTCIECCEGDAVCEALAGLADLSSTVVELVPQAGIANSLVAKLDAATTSVTALRITPALNQLDAFGNEVNALEQSGQISPAVSNIMKTKHDTVKNSISNIR